MSHNVRYEHSKERSLMGRQIGLQLSAANGGPPGHSVVSHARSRFGMFLTLRSWTGTAGAARKTRSASRSFVCLCSLR